jgi:hypothetical protein
MDKEEIYKRIDDYLEYAVRPMNKTHIKLDKHNAIDADAIRTLKHYKLIVYRYPLDENSSIIDITMAGTEVMAAGGIKMYIDLVESRRNAIGSDFSNKSNNNSNRAITDQKTVFVKFKKSGPDSTYLILAFVVALIVAYKVLHEMNIIHF